MKTLRIPKKHKSSNELSFERSSLYGMLLDEPRPNIGSALEMPFSALIEHRFLIAASHHAVLNEQNRATHILLQNENGPCPLLAAVNCLLLREMIELTPLCKDHGFITLEDLTNLLAIHAIQLNSSTHTFHIDELMENLPRFQFGMDVNPKFTSITAYEYTAELTAFDTLGATLVHGWLAEPGSAYAEALGSKSYNQVLDQILSSKEAAVELSILQSLAGSEDAPTDVAEKILEQQNLVKMGHLCQEFLDESSHQLTLAGVASLLKNLAEDQPCVLFRNNHYGVITKHMGSLYLLVTDLGYAQTADIVWERLDMVDGDTELCNADFAVRKPMLVHNPSHEPVDADLQAALLLSIGDVGGADSPQPVETPQELTDRMLAMQLQGEFQAPASETLYQHYDDALLAEELQRQENSRPMARQQTPSKAKNCCIM